MSRNNQMEFSRSGSEAIQAEFTKAIGPIEETLNSIRQNVDTLHEWWKGDSAAAFVDVFEEMKKNVHNELTGWLEANKALMRSIENVKFEGERQLASSIRGAGRG